MSEPIFSVTTERMYRRLPEAIRVADAAQIPDYPLKKFLSSVGDQLGEIDLLIARFDYLSEDERPRPWWPVDPDASYTQPGRDPNVPPIGYTSDLVDPLTADDAWLDWLAQIVGVNLSTAVTEQERRDAIQFSSTGFKAGSKQAIADAARSALTGTRYVKVYDHSTDANPGGIGSGTEWDVLLVTKTSETPDVNAVLEAINRKGAKPAGVVLFHRTFEASWDQIEAAYPTWNDWDTQTWSGIEETGV